MNISEIIKMALSAIRANKLRSVLTLLIIAFGIMALVGILTALDSVMNSLNESFNDLGANSFTLERKYQNIQGNRRGRRAKLGEPIDFDQAMNFKERFNYPSKVAVSIVATGGATVQAQEKKSNPLVTVHGIDENFLDVKGYDLAFGRNFSHSELESGSNKVIIGKEILKLFGNTADKAIAKDLLIGNVRYKVVGVLAEKGSGGGDQRADLTVMIPLLNAKRVYNNNGKDYSITVAVQTAADMEPASDVATGLFRQVRRLRLGQEDDFEVFKSDSLLAILKENTVKIRWATIAIGLITLLGASIGLMNIMLVSVTERTREIGIRKAIGATRGSILTQFLTEAIVICQLGGLTGIVLGVLAGFGVSAAMKGTFAMPWVWITMGIITCLIVGLFAGLYPALKAARLDPIESLRYE